MASVTRLMTFVDLDDGGGDVRQIAVSARHEAVLSDGRHVLLLNDRGWSASGPPDIWETTSMQEVVDTARMVVGPDEPSDTRSRAEIAATHWAHLAQLLGRQGINVDGRELERLPHDVELSDRLLARIGGRMSGPGPP